MAVASTRDSRNVCLSLFVRKRVFDFGALKTVCGFGFGIHIIVFGLVFTVQDRLQDIYILEVAVTRMWANAQRDGRPAEFRWRPLFNAAKFGF